MPINPRDLDEFLARIKAELDDPDLIANPFLSLVKPTEENLKKYYVFKPQSRLWLAISMVSVYPRILARVAYSSAISIARWSENHKWNINKTSKAHNLYISHFTYAQSPRSDDIFFGKNTQNSKDLVFYLNSTKERGFRIQDGYAAAGKRNVVVNTKSLGIIETLNMHRKQFRISNKLFLLALSNSTYILLQKRLLLHLSIFQHSRQTTANLITKVRLSELMSNCQPKNLILTIEGHAHEAMIIKLRDTSFAETRVIGFQHAPIVPGQFSFYRLLKDFKPSDLLLTCGKITERQISKLLPGLPTKVLGSLKSIEITSPLKDLSTLNVMGAVEGTFESLHSFIHIFNGLAILLPHVQFTLRIHPALAPDIARKQLKNLIKSSNLKISTNTLAEDLKNAHVTIFRSSAVGLEGLAYACLPVHFDAEKNGFLNPLSLIEYPKFEFSTIEELAEFLQSYPLAKNGTIDFREDCFKVIKNYYLPMQNLNLLID